MNNLDLQKMIENEISFIETLIGFARQGLNTHCIASLQRAIMGLENARADLQRKGDQSESQDEQKIRRHRE